MRLIGRNARLARVTARRVARGARDATGSDGFLFGDSRLFEYVGLEFTPLSKIQNEGAGGEGA
jgi:hypothetical protein